MAKPDTLVAQHAVDRSVDAPRLTHGSLAGSISAEDELLALRATRTRLNGKALAIVATYAVVAMLWIAFTDTLLAELAFDRRVLWRLSALKGVGFIVVTSAALHVVLKRAFRAVGRAITALEHKEAQRLRDEEQRRRVESIVEGSEDAILSTTLQGRIISWNPGARAMFGYEESEIIGQHVAVLSPPERAHEASAVLGGIIGDKRVRQFETVRLRKDGTRVPVAISFSPVCKPRRGGLVSTEVVGVSAIMHDITERKKAEALAEREARFAAQLTEATPGILYFYDESGRLLRWNRNFERITGYSAEEIAQMRPLDFFDERERPRVGKRIAEVFSRGESSVEATIVSKDGRPTPFVLTGRRVMFDERPCLIGVGMDITERKEAEARLRELNEQLELKVLDRTRALEAARERAEAADRLKSSFLATMSHELRTPLNSIIGFTGIVLQELAGPLTPEQTKQLGMVRDSARRLLALINDVLDISKIEAGQLELRLAAFDVRASIERLVELVRPLADKKGLSLQVELHGELAPFVSDQRRVEQILLNLLNNAIKFTDRGSVTLCAELMAPSRLLVRVVDSGIGIDEQNLPQLFQPFRQLDSGLERQHEGTGLGLAICRRLTERLGGAIRVESRAGQGSVFTVELPTRGAEP
jgi:PAS domain S-box-containing protein